MQEYVVEVVETLKEIISTKKKRARTDPTNVWSGNGKIEREMQKGGNN